jgi:hypothetical protein
MRREAYERIRQGENREALTLVEQALALDPYHPAQEQARAGLRRGINQNNVMSPNHERHQDG